MPGTPKTLLCNNLRPRPSLLGRGSLEPKFRGVGRPLASGSGTLGQGAPRSLPGTGERRRAGARGSCRVPSEARPTDSPGTGLPLRAGEGPSDRHRQCGSWEVRPPAVSPGGPGEPTVWVWSEHGGLKTQEELVPPGDSRGGENDDAAQQQGGRKKFAPTQTFLPGAGIVSYSA